MTEKAAAVAPVWVLDATCLSHFARAERLDVLRDLLVDKECWTARVVLGELDKGVAEYPALQGVRAGDWLKVAELDTWTRSSSSRPGSAVQVPVSVTSARPVSSQRRNFTVQQPLLTIARRFGSPGRTASTCMAPSGCLQELVEMASYRNLLRGT